MNNWESIIKEAYTDWQTLYMHDTYDIMFSKLDRKHKDAVILNNLSTTINNSGFKEWYANYSSEISEVVSALKFVNTSKSLTLANMIIDKANHKDIDDYFYKSCVIDDFHKYFDMVSNA